jgi:hypothetical protein
MKAFIAGGIAAVALANTAVSNAGQIARPQASRVDVATLQKQLNQMSARVVALEKRVTKLEKTQKVLISFSVGTAAAAACAATVAADAFETTWGVIDGIAGIAQAKTYFGPQTPLNDQKSCSDISVARQQIGVMPVSLSSFTTVINYLYGP